MNFDWKSFLDDLFFQQLPIKTPEERQSTLAGNVPTDINKALEAGNSPGGGYYYLPNGMMSSHAPSAGMNIPNGGTLTPSVSSGQGAVNAISQYWVLIIGAVLAIMLFKD